ncbi:nuclease [Mesorhizobium sp. LNJC399B00]|uniref:ParB/RepB/Spo0J family partition protein n=1 Tax=unclassified Mesorhizobium TaxID=325217 RepID=UPI0003CF0160|nr:MULTISPECIES: ParB/RepB/Spo0J family partition protein [unclassified Mesorhizobium]ESY01569.1 nuclease [Mesorhizobium sp. LNJC399B00]WJI72118.1 ParB/RepB/Spo0J family partition protein [Mesorhizobium sp. C399B]
MSAGEQLLELTDQFTARPASGATTGPPELRIEIIETMPELFQPRGGISERHVSDLIKAIKAVGALDPVTVMVVGNRTILIDGHHRVEAYGAAKWADPVPVRYFGGTPEEAVLVAGEANSKAKLPMDNTDRQNFAWRLVLIDKHSKAAVAKSSGISEAQVSIMRRAKKTLGEQAGDHKSWFRARLAANGKDQALNDDDEQEKWMEAVAERYADELTKRFSTKLALNPEIAARALSRYFGRKLPEVYGFLREHVGEDDRRAIEVENEDF